MHVPYSSYVAHCTHLQEQNGVIVVHPFTCMSCYHEHWTVTYMPLAPKGLNKLKIGGNAGPEFLLFGWGKLYMHDASIFPILHLDHTNNVTCTLAQYTCRQLAVLIQICVDCTAINIK